MPRPMATPNRVNLDKSALRIPAPAIPTLAEIGAALYGATWQRPMARDLGKGLRTVHRWASLGRVPNDAVMHRLLDLLAVRQAELGDLIIKVRPATEARPTARANSKVATAQPPVPIP